MGNTQRRMNIALAVDANGMDAGIQQALGKEKAFAAETKALNDKVAAARARWNEAKANNAPQSQIDAFKINLDWQRHIRDEAIATAKIKSSLDETYYRNTHTTMERELRDRQTYYMRLREMHQNNAEVLAKISRTEVAEIAAIHKRYETANPRNPSAKPGPAGWRKMFSGESPLRMAASTLGQTAAYNISPQVGLASSFLGNGGEAMGAAALPIAGVVGAAAALVYDFKMISDASKEATKYIAEMSDANREGIARAKALYSETHAPTGGEPQDAKLEELRKKIADATPYDANPWTGAGGSTSLGEIIGHVWGKMTGSNIVEDDQKRRQEEHRGELQDEYRKRMELKKRQEEVFNEEKKANEQSPVDQARIAGMYEGPAKRKAEMDRRQAAEIADAQRKNKLQAGSVDESKIAERHAIEVKNLERQTQDEIRQDREAASAAMIAATETGYNKELHLLQLKHQRELDDYQRAGKAKADLIARQAAEELALNVQRDRQLADMREDLSRQTDVITHSKSKSDAEWEQMSRSLQRDMGVTGRQLDDIEKKFRAMASARANQPLFDQMKDLTLNTQYARREITELEATRARLTLANPEASKGTIDANAKAQETLRIAQFSRGEADRLHPQRGYEDYKRNVMAGVESGDLSKEDAEDLLKGKLRDLTGDSGGHMTDASSHAKDIQQSLLQQNDTPKQTLQEIRSMRAALDRLRTEGLPMKG